MFEVGFTEIILILGIALVVLGPEKLPKVAAEIGRWMGRARAMARQLKSQLDEEVSLQERSWSQPGPKPTAPQAPESASPPPAPTPAGTPDPAAEPPEPPPAAQATPEPSASPPDTAGAEPGADKNASS